MRDLRKYTKVTNFRIIIGALFLIFIVGDGMIFFIYGAQPALMGLICLLGGLIPVFLILLVISIIDWTVKRANRD